MKNIETISKLIQNIDSKDQISNKDLLNIKGGQADPPPWGNFTGG